MQNAVAIFQAIATAQAHADRATRHLTEAQRLLRACITYTPCSALRFTQTDADREISALLTAIADRALVEGN